MLVEIIDHDDVMLQRACTFPQRQFSLRDDRQLHRFLNLRVGTVHRDTPEGVVAEMAAIVRAERQCILALAPEGTRKKVDHWRSGFYRIAQAAGVPVVAVWFDWSRREIGINAPMRMTGDLHADVAALQALYRPDMARNPAGFWDVDR